LINISNGTNPDTNFGRADGVTLKEFIVTIVKELREQFLERESDLGEKLHTEIQANDRLYQAKFLSSENAVKEAFVSSQSAINKSEVGQEKRSDAVYVSISALQKALSEVISRGEFVLANKNVDEKYDIIKKSVYDIQMIMNTFLTVSAYEIRHRELQNQVDDLKDLMANNSAKNTGVGQGWGTAVVVISVVIAIVTVLFKIFG
jgi:hypothetical protein